MSVDPVVEAMMAMVTCRWCGECLEVPDELLPDGHPGGWVCGSCEPDGEQGESPWRWMDQTFEPER